MPVVQTPHPPMDASGPVRVLVVHNAYRHTGGEEAVVQSEVGLLRSHGHVVELYQRNNTEISDLGSFRTAKQTLWSMKTSEEIEVVVSKFRPSVIHAHNTFPLISPSLFWAASRANVPTVQTLHNFRLLCVQAMFLRNERVCEDCLGTIPWRGIVRRCYRSSAAESAVLVGMLALHRALGTFSNKVSQFIALNEFCRRKFIEGGLPADRISVKPNFVDIEPSAEGPRAGGLYVGRLSAEKGIGVLVEAAAHLPKAFKIGVYGSGPEQANAEKSSNLVCYGWRSSDELQVAMRNAEFLVMPSLWYENSPRALIEAFASGLPVIASRIGALGELVQDGRTGLLFEAGSSRDLAEKMLWASSHPAEMRRLGKSARAEYESRYSPEPNYEQLMAIYMDVLARRASA